MRYFGRILLLTLTLALLLPAVAWADDCSTPEDCLDTGNVGGVISGIISAVAGGAIAAGVASATASSTAGAAEDTDSGDADDEPVDAGDRDSTSSADTLPDGWVNDTRVVGGEQAIDELVDAGAERDPDNPGCIRESSIPNVGGSIHGIGYTGSGTICPDDVAVIVDWPHPAADPVSEWVGGNDGEMSEPGVAEDVADQLRDRGLEPEIFTDENGNTHVRLPDDLPPNVSGIGYGTRVIIDENGNPQTVIDSGVWVQHWPPDADGAAPEPEAVTEEPPEEEDETVIEEPPDEEPPEEEEEKEEVREAMLEVRFEKEGFRPRIHYGKITDEIGRIDISFHTPNSIDSQLAQGGVSDVRGGNSQNIVHAEYVALLDGKQFAHGTANGQVSLPLPVWFAKGTDTMQVSLGTLLVSGLLQNVGNYRAAASHLRGTTSRSAEFRSVIPRLEQYPNEWLQQLITRDLATVQKAINALNLLRYMIGITRMTFGNFHTHWLLFGTAIDDFIAGLIELIAIPFLLGKLFRVVTAVPSKIWSLIPNTLKNLLWRALAKLRSAIRKGATQLAADLAQRIGFRREAIDRWAQLIVDEVEEGEGFFGKIGTWVQRLAMRCVGLVVRLLAAIWHKLAPHLVNSLGMVIYNMPHLSPMAQKAADDTVKWVAKQLSGVATDIDKFGEQMVNQPDAAHDVTGIRAKIKQMGREQLRVVERAFAQRLGQALDQTRGLQVDAAGWQQRTGAVSAELRANNRHFQASQETENFIVAASDWIRLILEFLNVALFFPIYLANRAISTFLFGLSKLQGLLVRGSGIPTKIPVPQSFDGAKIFLDFLDLFLVKTGVIIRQVVLLARERAQLDHAYERLYR